MRVIRLKERTGIRATSVGQEKVFAAVLALAERGYPLDDRYTISKEIGVTPALLNYYFGDQDLSERVACQFRELSRKPDC